MTELRDTQTEIFDLSERMHALEDTLLRTEIRSPTNGTVVGLGVHTLGGVISPSVPILEVVPQGEPLVVEARVQPTDIDSVHAGLPADARFTAFQARITPWWKAEYSPFRRTGYSIKPTKRSITSRVSK